MAKTRDVLRRDYDKLMGKAKDLVVLLSIRSLLEWDMETKMPPKAINLRSQQLAQISQLEHKMSTDREVGKLIDAIMKHPDYDSLGEVGKRNVHLTKKRYDEMTKLPEKLVVETARQAAITMNTWKKAKAAKNYSMYKPDLEKLFRLKKEAAEILMTVKETATPYDALIDFWEPKMSSEMITRVFDGLRQGMVTILRKCASSAKQPDTSFLSRKIPIDMQRSISNSIAKFIDYDIESPNAGGRIDETEHPFTDGFYDDVRITTHYYEDLFSSSLFSILHEGGHAMYDQNLKPEWMYQPVGMYCSLGFHESQSRFVENIVGRSYEFWTYYLTELKRLTGNILSDVPLDKFVHAINQVIPSKIRVEADEVTYCLHVIVRFNIERDWFAGKIRVDELPEVWNQQYMDYLGVKIENDSEGLMQDIHWSEAYFGYFPTYALGNIYSGQLLAKLRKDVPDWKTQLTKGNFQPVKQWLVKNVHGYGDLYDPADLIKKIAGEEINAKHYLDYLNEKYSKLYEY